jgi:ATP-dependent DNA helicase RecG
MTLDTPVAQLPRVGNVVAKRLAILGIYVVRDLLWYFPFRYEDYSVVTPLRTVPTEGQISVRGVIELIANKRSPRTRTIITEAVVGDGTERLRVVWFGQPFLTSTLRVGDEVYLSGVVKTDRFGTALVSPVYEKVVPDKATTHTARIVPIYSLTQGLMQKQMRSLVAQVLPMANTVLEWLPAEIRTRAGVIDIAPALHQIHFPDTAVDEVQSRRRLKFDELFVLQLRAAMIRQSRERLLAPACTFIEAPIRKFVATLPFVLTPQQKKAAWDIMQDMASSNPMNRLLEGDVGSGKTIVSVLALYLATLHKLQSVMMAPTEILAAQHFESLQQLFGTTEVSVLLVTRTMRMVSLIINGHRQSQNISKGECLKLLSNGEAQVVVGTHALLTDDIHFSNLGLVIVDEQHRFGVTQRKLIHEKAKQGITPHFLSMTATPIPRSLALSLYGDLEISQLRGMGVAVMLKSNGAE